MVSSGGETRVQEGSKRVVEQVNPKYFLRGGGLAVSREVGESRGGPPRRGGGYLFKTVLKYR